MAKCGKCCFNFLRIIVILMNLIFVLIGCAILGIAIFLYVDKTFKGIKDNMEEKRLMIDIVLFSAIGIGGITIIVSTFGCCGAYHESECLLGTYFFCLFVIVAAEVAAGVVGYLKFDEAEIKGIISKSFTNTIRAYMTDKSADSKPPEHLRQLQSRLSCCGANGYHDYVVEAGLSSIASLSMPDIEKLRLACSPNSGTLTVITAPLAVAVLPGCTNKIYTLLSDNKLWVLIICIGVAVFELGAMIFAMSLCCSVRRMESGYIGVST